MLRRLTVENQRSRLPLFQRRHIIFLAFPPLIIGGIVLFGVGGIVLSQYNKHQRQLHQESQDAKKRKDDAAITVVDKTGVKKIN